MTFPILPVSIFMFFPLISSACNSFNCLGHFKHVYDEDDDDDDDRCWQHISRSVGDEGSNLLNYNLQYIATFCGCFIT